ncbi:MAG: hypothetical protein ACOYM3_33015 [Terrimicrobiaceae bacterium]
MISKRDIPAFLALLPGPATVSSTTTLSDSGSIRTYKAKVPMNAAEKKFLRLKITALTN